MKSFYRNRVSVLEVGDRLLSSGWIVQLCVLLFSTLTIFGLCWLILSAVPYYFLKDGVLDHQSSFWLTICYFLQDGLENIVPDRPGAHGYIAVIIELLGSVMLSGVFVSFLINLISHRISRYEQGLITYKNITNHIVIVGHGKLTERLLREFLSDVKESGRVIVLSNADYIAVKRCYQSLIERNKNRVVFYSGDYCRQNILKRLNLQYSKRIYILGDEDDSDFDERNLKCARLIANILPDEKSTSPKKYIYVNFRDVVYYSIVQRNNVGEKIFKNAFLRPFNENEVWADDLWIKGKASFIDAVGVKQEISYPPLMFDAENGENKYVHLVISGFEDVGQMLLVSAIRLAHFDNFSEVNQLRTKITVLDPNVNVILPKFLSAYQHLEQVYDVDIEYIPASVEEYAEEIGAWAMDKNEMLTIVLSGSNDNDNLKSASSLPLETFCRIGRRETELPIVLVYQNEYSVVWEALRSEEQKAGKYARMYPFGMPSCDFYPTDIEDTKAMITNADYQQKRDNASSDFIGQLCGCVRDDDMESFDILYRHAMELWERLPENQKWANRYQVWFHRTLINYLQKHGVNDGALDGLSSELMLACAEMEHRRWVGERVATGWQQSPIVMNGECRRYNELMLHNLIVPFSELNNEEVGKDVDVINNLFRLESIDNFVKRNYIN